MLRSGDAGLDPVEGGEFRCAELRPHPAPPGPPACVRISCRRPASSTGIVGPPSPSCTPSTSVSSSSLSAPIIIASPAATASLSARPAFAGSLPFTIGTMPRSSASRITSEMLSIWEAVRRSASPMRIWQVSDPETVATEP